MTNDQSNPLDAFGRTPRRVASLNRKQKYDLEERIIGHWDLGLDWALEFGHWGKRLTFF